MPSKKEPKNKDDIDFEIQFIEGVLKEKPDFIEALTALGDLYTKKGWVEKGLAIDEKLSKLKPADPHVLYNLACSYSLTKEIEKSLDAIKRAINNGYGDLDYLQNDKDLDNLRQDSRFKEYLSQLRSGKSLNPSL